MHSKSKIDNKIEQVSDSTTQDRTYSIGEAAALIGSTVKTVRYYDEIGLLKPTSYTEGGHRLYTPEDIWRLELITTLRYLDFGIDEISPIISGDIPVDKALDWQIESLEAQASTLMNMISILRQAKEHEGDSLRYIYDLVKTRVINPEKRTQYSEQSINKEGFFRYFAECAQHSRTERIERFNTLCSILSPKFRLFSKGNTLLPQGIPWKLEHM
ncbi:MerR family transcriptional regulator [Paenibacillus apiarius]|uniref:MerR family transcriptional regulator n=1 Tax=Paenibacillus apiarius TaxID=46240 RepID=UPI003B3B4339